MDIDPVRIFHQFEKDNIELCVEAEIVDFMGIGIGTGKKMLMVRKYV